MARFCTSCGTQAADETARFCPKCGAAVAALPNASVAISSPSVSGRKGKTIPMIVAGALTLLTIVAVSVVKGKSDGAASQQAISQQPAQTVATTPARPVPQLFSHPLFILTQIHLTDGETIKEVNDAIFKSLSETEQLAAMPLVCAHPYPNDPKIHNDMSCKTIIRTQTPDGDQFELLLAMNFGEIENPHPLPDANEGDLVWVFESFPVRYADKAREWLTAQYGDPTSYNPTSWERNGGCGGYNPAGRMIYGSGPCFTVTLMSGTDFFLAEPLKQPMSEDEYGALSAQWETVQFQGFVGKDDIEHAKQDWQPTGEITAKQADGSYATLICDGKGNCTSKHKNPTQAALKSTE